MCTINKEITKTNIHSLHTSVFYVLILTKKHIFIPGDDFPCGKSDEFI